jgi:hypothetical protein
MPVFPRAYFDQLKDYGIVNRREAEGGFQARDRFVIEARGAGELPAGVDITVRETVAGEFRVPFRILRKQGNDGTEGGRMIGQRQGNRTLLTAGAVQDGRLRGGACAHAHRFTARVFPFFRHAHDPVLQ